MDATLAQMKIKSALKSLIKSRGFTFQDVAELWQCSLPTVKRQLGPEELPVSRLLSLLDWLGLSLGELQKLAESGDLDRPRFTVKQIEYLAKNLRSFGFLMKLYEGLTPQQIAKKYGLDSALTEKILLQLERVDLIRVNTAGKVRPVYADLPPLDGQLALATMRKQIDRMGEFMKLKIADTVEMRQRGVELPPGQYSWSLSDVTEASYREFLKRVERLLADFADQCKLDEMAKNKKSLKKAVISFGAQLEDAHSPRLQLITEVFTDELKCSGHRGLPTSF